MRVAPYSVGNIMRLIPLGGLLVLALLEPSLGAAPVEVQIEMKNVRLHAADGIVLEVASLQGLMVSRKTGAPPVFDDQQSYVLRLSRAEVSLDLVSLQNLLNQHVFAYKGAPLENLTVQNDQGQLALKGKLHKGIAVPFSVKASVAATPDGRMRLHGESMKAVGIPAKGLLDLFGLKLEDVVDIKARRGIEIQDNDIIISAGQVLPPPEIAGRLVRATVSGNRLVQVFDDPAGRPSGKPIHPPPGARNYIYFGGGEITFGKLTMHDADLQLIDSDPKDPFDFFPARYDAQLIAGYSKNTPAKGLKTYMPDYEDLKKRPAKAGAAPSSTPPAARRPSS
jgi:hypothetical protein